MRRGRDFEFNDTVPSDVSFVARGESLEALFAAAAEALLASTIESPGSVAHSITRSVALAEPDLDLECRRAFRRHRNLLVLLSRGRGGGGQGVERL